MTSSRPITRAALLPLIGPFLAGTGGARAAQAQSAFAIAPAPSAAADRAAARDSARTNAATAVAARDSVAHAPVVAAPVAVAGPDRPGYSFTPVPVPAGGVQLESGYTDARTGPVRYQSIGEQLLRVGVGHATEVRFAANSYALRTVTAPGTTSQHARGVEDASLGIKHQLAAGNGTAGLRATSVAVMAGTSVPSGARTFGAGAWQPTASLIVNTPITERVAVLTNASDTYLAPSATIDGVRAHRLGLSGAAWLTLTPRVSAFGEYAGTRLARPGAGAVHYADTGIALTPTPRVQLDVRAGHGMNGVRGDRFVGAGVTRRW